MIRFESVIPALMFSILSALPTLAQQPTPQQDPQILIYRQLLDQANAQLASVAAQLQTAQARVKELEEKEKPNAK